MAMENGFKTTMPTTAKMTPKTRAVYASKEKYLLARASSPSPRVLATIAPPPVPSMVPNTPTPISKGMTRFTAANAVVPTKLEMKRPSTML